MQSSGQRHMPSASHSARVSGSGGAQPLLVSNQLCVFLIAPAASILTAPAWAMGTCRIGPDRAEPEGPVSLKSLSRLELLGHRVGVDKDQFQLPSDEAYGRVTNPERYRPLHAAADQFLGELERSYDVDRVEGLDVDDLGGRVELARVFRLVPRSGVGSALTIGFTTFPGLLVRHGRWHVGAYPHCGCDACDEQVETLVADLRDCTHLLCSGRFTETLTASGGLAHEYTGRSRGWQQLSNDQAAALGKPGHLVWAAWPLRTA